MTSVAFDTLRLARALREKAKFTPEQAEGLADAMAEALQGDVATKVDLRETELRLQAELRDTEARLQADLRQTELRLKTDIEASKAEILKWMFGTIGFQTIVILDTTIALFRIAVH